MAYRNARGVDHLRPAFPASEAVVMMIASRYWDCATNGVSGPIRRILIRRDGHCE
jgi:hypothetical protein